MHIYCINLERRKDRREACVQEFTRAGLGPVEFFTATDGRAQFPDEIETTPAEYGCAMSHVRVWKDIVRHGYPMALIFEDDVRLYDNFMTKLRKIIKEALVVPEWDLLFLGYITPVYRRMVSENLMEARPLGTHSYIITLECARKLCNFDPKFMKVGIDFTLNKLPLKIICSRDRMTDQGLRFDVINLNSILNGDIGFERTVDVDFCLRYWAQKGRHFIILVLTILVLSCSS